MSIDESAPDKISIFISHKMTDSDAAKEIKRELEKFSKERLEVFTSEETPPGVQWLSRIMESISDARIFLLLLTGPRPTWDWSLLELGLFIDPRTWGDEDHVICMHHEQTPIPDAVSAFQALPVSSSNLEKLVGFLKRLYGDPLYVGTELAINSELAQDTAELQSRAVRIAQYFDDASAKPHYPHMRLVLGLEDQDKLSSLSETGELPMDARIMQDDEATLPALFSFRNDGNCTWSEIVERSVARGTSDWCTKLGQACAKGLRNETNISIGATVRTIDGGAIYKPILYRIDSSPSGGKRFHVLFEPEKAPHSFAGEDNLGRLYNMLRVGHRFRMEVVASYQGRMEDIAASTSVESSCQRLREVIELIEDEANSQNLLDANELTKSLTAQNHKKRARSILEKWVTSLRESLFDAISENDLSRIEEHLEVLKRQNREFLEICSASYAKLARDIAKEDGGSDSTG